MKYFFVGAFSDLSVENFRGSAAGTKVQMEIVEALSKKFKPGFSFVMPEIPSWPKDKFFIEKKTLGAISFLPLINFKLIKRPCFFFVLFFYFLKLKPEIVFQYNTSISGCVFTLFLRLFSCRSVLILQDVKSPANFSPSFLLKPKKLIEFLFSKLLPVCFDFYVPITDACIRDFNLPRHKCEIFPGGVLKSYVESVRSIQSPGLEPFGVFAGALEEYNGVDLLVSKWPTPEEIEFKLHVFGRGKLEHQIESEAAKNGNVVFHGYQAPEIVNRYSINASYNFCLRYSKGINEEYFFPSKFFDLILLKGTLICNHFDNIPEDLKLYVNFVDGNLDGLVNILGNNSWPERTNFLSKIDYLEENYTWFGLFERFSSKFGLYDYSLSKK